MRKLSVLLIICLGFVTSHFGQNLVPNPGFEEYNSCPNSLNQIDRSENWKNFGASPDYYNECSDPGNMSVPFNFYGYQNAANGNAYAGIVTWAKDDSPQTYQDIREFIGVELTTPLIINQKYYVSFKTNFTLNEFETGYATNKIGVRFSMNEFDPVNQNYVPINNSAHIYSDEIISDTLGWTSIKGSFIADSAYNFLTVGNFFQNNAIDSIVFDENLFGSYYYIDDVCVSLDSNLCHGQLGNSMIDDQPKVQVYPIPATDIINISIQNNSIITIEILSLTGKIVYFEETTQQNNSIDLSSLEKGIYILNIRQESGLISKKIILD